MNQPEPKGTRKRERVPDNLYQRNGIWCIRYNVAGEKHRYSLKTKSLREAKRLRDQILGKRSVAAQFGLEEPIPRKEFGFAEVVAAWLLSRQANGELRAATVSSAEYVSRGWILPTFGNRPISDITVEDIERFITHLRSAKSERTGEPLKRAYIAKICKYLGTIFRYAQRRQMLHGPNPFEQLEKRPTVGPGRDVRLTEEEARRLLDKLSGVTFYKAALALSTGLRWGEIHGLAWADINLDGQTSTITIRRSWRGDPKSEHSAATLPISDDAAATLRIWKGEQGEAVYVFPNSKGELRTSPKREEVIAISKAAQDAGITCKVTPHIFRHTFATWTYECAKDPRKLQRLLRHASFDTSMGYVHEHADLASLVNQLPAMSRPRLKAA